MRTMKPRNALVLAFAICLLAQIPLRELYVEPYPLIVLPAGAGVYEHETDTVSGWNWKATAYVGKEDSTTIPGDDLFPGSPVHYQKNMYSTLVQADTSSEQWSRTVQWIHRNLTERASLSDVDSLCVHGTRRVIPIGEGASELRYEHSTCYNLRLRQ